jgi:putative thioredoxin
MGSNEGAAVAMGESTWVLDVNEREFAAIVEQSRHRPVLLDFWAEWCQPCRILGPLLEQLAEERAGQFLLAKVNVDHCPTLAQQFQVSGIPMVVALRGGRIVDHFVGVLQEPQIVAFLDRIAPSESEQLVMQASEALPEHPAKARELFEQALEKDPKNSMAAASLAELLLDAGTEGWSRATNTLARIEFLKSALAHGNVTDLEAKVAMDPKDLEAKRELGIAYAAAGKFEQALETLVQIVETDRSFGNEHAKTPMVKIFNILGAQHELSNRFRSRLASALY